MFEKKSEELVDILKPVVIWVPVKLWQAMHTAYVSKWTALFFMPPC